MDPKTTFEAFIAAVAAGDEDTAHALSTEDGWSVGGDSAARFVRQALHQTQVDVRQSAAARVHGDRAAVPATIASADGVGDAVWFLLRETPAGWRVDGTATSWPVAGLYVHGAIHRPPAFAELPPAEAGEVWARGWIARDPVDVSGPEGVAAREMLEELRDGAMSVEVSRAVEVPGSGRVGVALTFSQPDGSSQTVWAILEAAADTGLLRLVGRSWVGSVDSLLQGLDPAWPVDPSDAGTRRYSDAEARAILEQAVAEALAERAGTNGQPAGDEFGGRIASVLVDLFTGALDDSEAGDEAEVTSLEDERGRRGEVSRGPTDTEARIQRNLAEAFRGLFADRRVGDLDADDLRIDSAFVREKGPEMVTSLLGAFATALFPQEVTLAAPAADDAEAAPPLALKVDVGDLVKGLFAPREASSDEPPPKTDGGGSEDDAR